MSRANPRFKRNNPSLPAVGTTNGVVLLRLIGLLEGQVVMNTCMYSSPAPNPTQGQLATLLSAMVAAIVPPYTACLSADYTYDHATLSVVHRNDLATVVNVNSSGTAGGRGAGHLPTENAIVLLRNSAIKGQHGRGRISLPAINPADITLSKISAAALITALGNLETQLLATRSDGTNTWTPCIGQRSPTSPKLVIGFSPITTYQTTTLIGTVRRRKLGRGK